MNIIDIFLNFVIKLLKIDAKIFVRINDKPEYANFFEQLWEFLDHFRTFHKCIKCCELSTECILQFLKEYSDYVDYTMVTASKKDNYENNSLVNSHPDIIKGIWDYCLNIAFNGWFEYDCYAKTQYDHLL